MRGRAREDTRSRGRASGHGGVTTMTEETMMDAAAPPKEEPVKEKKRKAGMKKKESDIDYEALEKQIAGIKSNAAGSSAEKLLSETLEELLALEKTYRLQADLKATSMCGVAVVQVRNPPLSSPFAVICASLHPPHPRTPLGPSSRLTFL